MLYHIIIGSNVPKKSDAYKSPVPKSPVPTSPVPTSPVPTSPVPTNPVPTSPVPTSSSGEALSQRSMHCIGKVHVCVHKSLFLAIGILFTCVYSEEVHFF